MALAFVAAAGFYPALKLAPRIRAALLFVHGVAVALTPFLIPPEHRFARCLVATYAGIMFLKLWDLHIGAKCGDRPQMRESLAFLANVFFLVQRKKGLAQQPTRARNLRNLAWGLLGTGATFTAMKLLGSVDWSSLPFLLQHSLKATVFFLFGLSAFHSCVAITRLLGGYIENFSDRPLMARTPAEFWRRYNRLVGQFLHEDVFRPLGGYRHPIGATLAAFAVSGLLHEYMATVAIGRPQGLQLAFFLLHGCAVALTLRVRPTGVTAVAWGLGTLAFNIASSILFLVSCNNIIRIYQSELPPWLRVFQDLRPN